VTLIATPDFPPVDNALTRPFWDGVGAGEIRLPRCSACGAYQWYPLGVAEHGDGGFFEWSPVATTGTVFTHTTVRRPFLPGTSKADVPYHVILVELDGVPGVRLVGRLREGDEPAVGQRVTAEFVERAGRPDLQFVPA
jgi:uncharacterized OB-fold protein